MSAVAYHLAGQEQKVRHLARQVERAEARGYYGRAERLQAELIREGALLRTMRAERMVEHRAGGR